MSNPQSRQEAVAERLSRRGFRITPQRMAILELLLTDHRHPSVEEIHDGVKRSFPMTSLATVYKTVALLTEIGEVAVVNAGENASRYDGLSPWPHAHLTCTQCGRVVDAPLPEGDALRHEVSERLKSWVVQRGPHFYGICPECQVAQSGPKPADKTRDR